MPSFPYRLGRLPSPLAKLEKALKLTAYLPADLPPAPARVASGVAVFNMALNDRLGCCTASGAAHLEEVWTDQVDGEPRIVSDNDVLKFYELQGYNPTDPFTDQGANMMDVLSAWRKVGLAGDQILAYVRVAVEDRTLEQAVWLFGGAYIGVNLPDSAIEQFQAGEPWEVVMEDGGIAGGHCVVVVGYDSDGCDVVTWGKSIRASWAWLATYCEEAWAVLPSEYQAGKVNGFDLDQLRIDLEALSAEA
jgi:hypothetical protein